MRQIRSRELTFAVIGVTLPGEGFLVIHLRLASDLAILESLDQAR
jgi:hypothetical protein